MRHPCLPTLLLFAACQGGAPSAVAPAMPRPTVPVALELAEGTRFYAELRGTQADDPLWRAAEVWWREALRQSVRFELVDPTGRGPTLGAVQLAIDAEARRLSAFYRAPDGALQALAGAAYPDDNLPAAIDRLAWAARLALGEDAAAPVPVALCVSPEPRAVTAVVDGQALLRDGAVQGALRAFRDARVRDGASTFVLEALAAAELLRGDAEAAERLSREALGFEPRLSPTTQHRLARTLMLARASTDPDAAHSRDVELLALGIAGQRERPHDPQPALTIAIANNFLGDFATARPQFERLDTRLPDLPIVPYHLGWACLATGDAKAAVRCFERAALRLPMPWVAVPRCIALYAAGDHEALQLLLQGLVDELTPSDAPLVHDLRRMQSAHALLRGDYAAAADLLVADLNWLLQHPAILEHHAGQLADQGAVLVRLGRASVLPPLVAAMQGQHPASAVADVCAYLAGLAQIAQTNERALALEDQLGRGGESVFSVLLAAFAHEQRGEIADLNTALGRAARLSDSPMTKALLARSLRAMGKTTEAEQLRTAVRSELLAIHLRRRPQHPLLGPELAFAFRAE